MKIALIVVSVAVLLFTACYLVALKMFKMMFRRAGVAEDMEKHLLDSLQKGRYADKVPMVSDGMRLLREGAFEEVYIQSYDGLQLYGQLFHGTNPTRTVVMSHGYQSSPTHDFGGAMGMYMEDGANVLVIHHRTHGKSQGEYICFGAKERYDVRDWCKYLVSRFGEQHKIVLAGVSMGATTILLAACLPDIPKQVVGVVADCGFVSPIDEYRHVLRTRFHLPGFPLLPIAERICVHRAGFMFSAFSTAEELKRCKIPILFAHGEADSFVPVSHTQQAYEACASRKELLIVPDAEHGLSFLEDEPLYRATVKRFLESV